MSVLFIFLLIDKLNYERKKEIAAEVFLEEVGFIGKYFFCFIIPSQIRCGNIIGQILQC